MCTVTYIPHSSGFVLTSSRDERIFRPTIPPQEYDHAGHKLLYPKDKLAGGTWIASSADHRVTCLLNGAFEKHLSKKHYRKSRGQVLLESFEYASADQFYKKVNLEDIEPFTLLMLSHIEGFEFSELRWDGKTKHYN